jgi:hypothetical protein
MDFSSTYSLGLASQRQSGVPTSVETEVHQKKVLVPPSVAALVGLKESAAAAAVVNTGAGAGVEALFTF